MADEKEIDQAVNWLLQLYSQSSELNTSSLNTDLRKSLLLLPAKFRVSFKVCSVHTNCSRTSFQRAEQKNQQDNVGNIYMTRSGRDPELLGLGICFPLDGSTSPGAFEGALRTFLALKNSSFSCDISLIGWSSPAGKPLGHDVWEGEISLEEGTSQAPDLKQFSSMESLSTFGMSALFEIVVAEEPAISIQGSPVLVQKAASAAEGPVKTQSEGRTLLRAPEVRIEGRDAVSVGRTTVELYGKYIAAIFDNFD
ncbi:hypothetical protein VTN77DRAFT_4610 [Rasamsonia byssochlamydoides]|uniref:uncharacterized protein n=1 Tax=Rasamsonia byssochlamydoides TaxID=89139 RepID=UPI003744094F